LVLCATKKETAVSQEEWWKAYEQFVEKEGKGITKEKVGNICFAHIAIICSIAMTLIYNSDVMQQSDCNVLQIRPELISMGRKKTKRLDLVSSMLCSGQRNSCCLL